MPISGIHVRTTTNISIFRIRLLPVVFLLLLSSPSSSFILQTPSSLVSLPPLVSNLLIPSLLLPTVQSTSFVASESALVSSSTKFRLNMTTKRKVSSEEKEEKKKENDDTINLSSSSFDLLIERVNSYASANGVQVRCRQQDTQTQSHQYEPAPISLLPNAYPKSAFDNAIRLSTSFNMLTERVSTNATFLTATLGSSDMRDTDEFTTTMLDMYRYVYCSGSSEKGDDDHVIFTPGLADRLGVLRSDYMLHPLLSSNNDDDDNNSPMYGLKQVELNTIASSFGSLSQRVAGMHRHLIGRFGGDSSDGMDVDSDSMAVRTWLRSNRNSVLGGSTTKSVNDKDAGVPENPSLRNLANAIAVGHKRYVSRFTPSSSSSSTSPVVLFVVQDGETNVVDQNLLEFRIWDDHGISVERISLKGALGRIVTASDDGDNDKNGALFLLPPQSSSSLVETTTTDNSISGLIKRGGREVSVVYYRAGYTPDDYPSGDWDRDTSSATTATKVGAEWTSRLIMEQSRATKCPCLGYHLAGTKKVQQELARPGVLESFFPSSNGVMDETNNDNFDVEGMRQTFATLHSLGSDMSRVDLDAVGTAIFEPDGGDRFVLKPQREGGGYNIYGDDMVKALKEDAVVDVEGDAATGKRIVTRMGGKLGGHILMERLNPPVQRAALLRRGALEGVDDSISELGCFGTILMGSSDDVTTAHHNEYSGFLLRTKFCNVDEGGVASGFATLSSPYLC